METTLKTTKIIYFIIFNLILVVFLYNIPVNEEILKKICIFKIITGKPCWNCGMTRAFLNVLHFKFELAYQLNSNVILVFPLTIICYLFSWYKYIFKKGEN